MRGQEETPCAFVYPRSSALRGRLDPNFCGARSYHGDAQVNAECGLVVSYPRPALG